MHRKALERSISSCDIIVLCRKICELKIGKDYGTWRIFAMSYDDSSILAKAVPRRQASTHSSTN